MIVSFEEALEIYHKIPDQYHSFYYHPNYIEASSKENPELTSIYFIKEESNQFFYHAALIGDIKFEGLKDLQTPYGYGGPLIIGEQNFKEQVIDEYIACCEDLNILAEFIRFHPLVGNVTSYYGQTLENRSTIAIDLTKEDIFKSFSTRVKTAIRAAEKNKIEVIVSKQEPYIEKFLNIYTQLMLEKQTADEYFFSKEYIENLLLNENVYLLNAVNKQGEVLGASIFMIDGFIADYHLSATTYQGKLNNVSHLLIYKFAEMAKKNEAQRFYLGGGTDNDPTNSLLFFKKGFSKSEYIFSIGYHIFNQAKYDKLKQSYLATTDNSNNKRILFYR